MEAIFKGVNSQNVFNHAGYIAQYFITEGQSLPGVENIVNANIWLKAANAYIELRTKNQDEFGYTYDPKLKEFGAFVDSGNKIFDIFDKLKRKQHLDLLIKKYLDAYSKVMKVMHTEKEKYESIHSPFVSEYEAPLKFGHSRAIPALKPMRFKLDESVEENLQIIREYHDQIKKIDNLYFPGGTINIARISNLIASGDTPVKVDTMLILAKTFCTIYSLDFIEAALSMTAEEYEKAPKAREFAE